jgi:ABC-type nickel/cobalt efflux system permease component RcnA
MAMNWVFDVQRWLYGGMGEGLTANPDLSALPGFLGAALAFGMVHALMPGHGKGVLVSYHLGRRSRVMDGLITGALLSVTHVGLAVVLVTAGVAVISRSVAVAGRAPAFEAVSALFVMLVGSWLLFRAWRPTAHGHSHDGKALAFVTGLIPCPLTTFILIYAGTHGQLALGLATVAAMLAGVIVTIAGFAVCAILMRDRLDGLLAGSEHLREGLGRGLELASALAVLTLGTVMLASHLRWL